MRLQRYALDVLCAQFVNWDPDEEDIISFIETSDNEDLSILTLVNLYNALNEDHMHATVEYVQQRSSFNVRAAFQRRVSADAFSNR